MSKKMLKRSLALGAMMAFVITGNVLAANMTNQAQADEINENTTNYVVDGAITASGSDIIVSGNKDATVLTVSGGDVDYYKANGKQEGVVNVGIGGDTRDTQDKQITIKNLKLLNISAIGRGVSAGSDASNIGLPKGKVYIDNTVLETNIKAHHGVIAGGENALVKIESEKVNIEAGISLTDSYGLGTVAGGEIQLGTKENKIVNLSVNGSLESGARSFAIRSSNTNSNIYVLANDVHLKSNHTAIRSHAGNIFLGVADNMLNSINAETYGNGIAGNAVIDFSAQKGQVELYSNEVSLINHEEGQNAISVGNTGTLKIVAKEELYIKGNITSFTTTPIIDINTGVNDALVKIEGNISLSPNAAGEGYGTTKLTLGAEGSYLKGKVTDAIGGVTLNMNEGTTWNVTGASTVGTVSGDGATIKVDSLQADYVKVGNGSNAFNFTLLGGRNVTDKLDGDNLEDSMEDVASIVNGITFASYEFEEGTALGAIEACQENGEWKITERTNVTNTNISDVAALGLMAWRSEMNDMNKRLGELRNANGEHGVWVRMVRGETEYEAVKNQYNTYQLGYDEKLSVDKSWTVGMALTYTDGESSFNGGNGENKHKGLAIYGSKLNDDGSFVDLIAKYARLDHDVEVGTEKGDYEANGYSVSAEYGKCFQQGNGLWVEPQVELTYGKVGSADYMIGKNRAVTHEGMKSLVGRVGFSLGKDIKQGNVYARASYLYDFEGETEASYTDAIGNVRNINDDLGGGWWEVGVGANINLSKATYIYADIEKTFGGEVDTNWQWNLGVRYSF